MNFTCETRNTRESTLMPVSFSTSTAASHDFTWHGAMNKQWGDDMCPNNIPVRDPKMRLPNEITVIYLDSIWICTKKNTGILCMVSMRIPVAPNYWFVSIWGIQMKCDLSIENKYAANEHAIFNSDNSNRPFRVHDYYVLLCGCSRAASAEW